MESFDPANLKNGSKVVVHSRGGADWALRDLAHRFADSPHCVYVSKRPLDMPPRFALETFRPSIVEDAIGRQKQACKSKALADPRAVWLFDDCRLDLEDPSVAQLFMNGHCFRITLVVTTSDPSPLPPSYRTNVNYVALDHHCTDREMFQAYGGMFETHHDFLRALRDCAADGGLAVLDVAENKIRQWKPTGAAETRALL